MSLRSSLFMGVATLLPAYLPAHALAAPDASLELRRDALVEQARIVLGDVAVVPSAQPHAEALRAVALGQAPRVGYVERFSRAQLEQAIRRQVPNAGAIDWSGAAVVAVRTRAQSVPAQAMADVAIAAARARFYGAGRRVDVSLAVPLNDLEVPAGALEVRARPSQAKVQGGRLPLWLDLLVNGKVYRSVVAELAVSAQQQAYVARRALQPGELASAADFEVLEADVAGADALPADRTLPAFRVGRAVRAGEALSAGAMLESGKILRGDQVRVRVMSGQIGIETSAVAMADAAPGQALRVRPSGGTDIVTGRVNPSGVVIIE